MAAAIIWSQGRIDNTDTLISSFSFEDAISETYLLKIICHGSGEASLPKAFDYVTFIFNNQKISGMLLKITKHQDHVKKRWDYVLEVRPRLHILALRRTISLYPNKSINAILLDLLQNARIALGSQALDYNNLISESVFTTPFKRLEISYAQNDLLYLQALLQYGVRFCFEENEEGEQVTFIDAPYKLPQYKAALKFTPKQKEDIHQDQPLVYQVLQEKRLLPAQGCAIFYDPKAVSASLNNLMQTNNTPNDKVFSTSGAPSTYMADCYSPPALEATMSERINQLIHHDQHSYKLYSYYSGLRAGQQINFENIHGFIERVYLKGIFEHDAWRFDSVATLRSFNDSSWLGPMLERMPLPPTLTGAEIQGEDQVNDLGEFKIKFPTRFVTDSNNDPWVTFRDVQATTTSEGGASNSMSGNAEVLIASQNGASYDWMILGSLDNNERPSNITAQNYRESKINTTGGVNVHLRRQDESNPYSELNMSTTDSQNNPAGMNLGTSIPTMTGDTEQHGIQEISSGYGKRSIMGNLYDTVGDPQNPVHQVALTQDAASGMTTLNKQTNVSDSGSYNKSYYVSAVGASMQQSSKAPETTKADPNIKHHFYVVDQEQNLFDLANSLYGNDSSQDKLNFMYLNHTIPNALSVLNPGTWIYIPQTKQKYAAGTSIAVAQTLQAINQNEEVTNTDLSVYASWHKIFSWDLDNNLLVFAGSYFTSASQQINEQLQAISNTLNQIGKVNQEAKASAMTGGSINSALYQEQTKVLGENLHNNISQLVKTLGVPDTGFKTEYETATGLIYDRNVLGFKVNGLSENDVASLVKLKTQSLKMAQAAQGLGRALTVINGLENAEDIKETCKKYGDGSTLCHKTAVGNTAGFVAGEYGGEAAGSVAGVMAGCDAVFGIETLGAGVAACTVVIGGAAIAGGGASTFAIKRLSNKIYDSVKETSQNIKIFHSEYLLTQ